jgi:branched-chain amino acid aminotransferase
MVMVTPRVMPPQWWYSEGVKIITVDAERFLPPAKGTSYLSAVCAQRLAKVQKAIEAVYVDRHHRLLEATTSNLFFFKKGKLITPDCDILPGITRNVVLELARGRFEIELRDVGRSELNDMEEVFLTASSKEVVPVVEIETSRVCDGRPGRNTREIMRLWREYTRAYGQGDR